MKKTTNAGKTVMKVGAGLATAAAVAAAGYYFYASKGAKKHRKIAAKWASDMKVEVIKEAKKLEKMSPKAYAALVDRIAKTYETARTIKAGDVKRAARELKANWTAIQREAKRTVHKSVSRAKKTAKNIVKAR